MKEERMLKKTLEDFLVKHSVVNEYDAKKIAGWGAILTKVILFTLLLIPTWTSWYTISPESVGIVIRFGKFVRQAKPGLNFKMPWPVEQVTKVPVQRQLKEEFGFRTLKPDKKTVYDEKGDYTNESLMLTGDLNIVEVEWVAQYRISDPYKWLFRVRNSKETFRDANEAVMRKIVGNKTATQVLTIGRQEIAGEAKRELQDLCNKYSLGIIIDQIVLQDVTPPDPVKPAFNEVNQALQEKKQMINNAWAEYNRIIPKAKGEALRTIQEAQGFATERVNKAKGDIVFFTNLLKAYKKNPDITRERLYLETMQNILPRIHNKTIVDSKVNNLIPMLKVGGGK